MNSIILEICQHNEVDPINVEKKDINWADFILDLKGGKMIVLERVYSLNKRDFVNYAHRFRVGDDQILEVYQNSIFVLNENVIFDKIKS